MRAHVGDRIILAGENVDQPTRDGRILEVRGDDDGPPFLVEWSDGHTGLIFPGPGSILRIGTEAHETPAAEPTPTAHPSPTPETARAGAGRVREWQVRVSIFESGDDTSAQAVLLADSPEHLSGRGTSHRSDDDAPVPEIGDEVAVARALRHLAERLVQAAETDIEMMTGEEAHVRPV